MINKEAVIFLLNKTLGIRFLSTDSSALILLLFIKLHFFVRLYKTVTVFFIIAVPVLDYGIKIYDATAKKTSFKSASSGLLIFLVIMSVCLTSKN